jgi:beta-barrel assembly-enhancing protease
LNAYTGIVPGISPMDFSTAAEHHRGHSRLECPAMKRAALTILLALAACAPQSQRPTLDSAAVAQERQNQERAAVENRRDQVIRLQSVTWRLATAAEPLCHDEMRGWVASVYTHSRADYAGLEESAERVLGLSDNLTVLGFPPNSPVSGLLRVGDQITDVDGVFVPLFADKPSWLAWHMQDDTDRPLKLKVIRGSDRLSIDLPMSKSCRYWSRIDWSEARVNAFADGKKITVTAGMMRFVQSDDELAFVTGHELAHNLRAHIDAMEGNQIGGMILGSVLDVFLAAGGVNTGGAFGRAGGNLAAGAYSQDFEAEADYVGLYISTIAGYDPDKALPFWRRMGAENPDSILHARSHPATPERFVALTATIKEIDAKKAAGLPLIPNEKSAEAGK